MQNDHCFKRTRIQSSTIILIPWQFHFLDSTLLIKFHTYARARYKHCIYNPVEHSVQMFLIDKSARREHSLHPLPSPASYAIDICTRRAIIGRRRDASVAGRRTSDSRVRDSTPHHRARALNLHPSSMSNSLNNSISIYLLRIHRLCDVIN